VSLSSPGATTTRLPPLARAPKTSCASAARTLRAQPLVDCASRAPPLSVAGAQAHHDGRVEARRRLLQHDALPPAHAPVRTKPRLSPLHRSLTYHLPAAGVSAPVDEVQEVDGAVMLQHRALGSPSAPRGEDDVAHAARAGPLAHRFGWQLCQGIPLLVHLHHTATSGRPPFCPGREACLSQSYCCNRRTRIMRASVAMSRTALTSLRLSTSGACESRLSGPCTLVAWHSVLLKQSRA